MHRAAKMGDPIAPGSRPAPGDAETHRATKRLLGIAESRSCLRPTPVSAVCETSEVFHVQVTVPGNVPPQLIMHPVEPSNTATSVAAAALAFNIRRLVLFAFIRRAFFLCGCWHSANVRILSPWPGGRNTSGATESRSALQGKGAAKSQ